MENIPRVAVRAIITNENSEILLLKRAGTEYCPGCWNLPGGKVDFGDSVLDTLKKEVKEETSLDVTKAVYFMYLDNLPTDELNTHFITFVFTAITNGIVDINGESSAYAWVGKENLKNYNIAFRNEEAMLEYWYGPTL